MKLTDTFIRNLPIPENKNGKKYFDQHGLHLHIFPNSTKCWRYSYFYYGKFKLLSLGTYPFISLKKARELHLKARCLLAEGKDPCTEKQREKQQRKANCFGNTFAEIAREWHQVNLPRWSRAKNANQILQRLIDYAFPYFGNQPINTITTPQISQALQNCPIPKTSIRIQQDIKRVFKYAVHCKKCTYNPVDEIPIPKSKKETTHQPALPIERLPEFFTKLEAYDSSTVQLAIKFLIITFVRSGELRLGEWSEIKGNEWHIPKEKMKMNRPHIVPLSDWALELLEELKSYSKNNLIIHGTSKKPLSDNTLSIALRRMGYQGIATPHGFRAMASTILNEKGFNPDAIEMQLSHLEQNKVRAAYNRGFYLEERHQMMQWYSDYIKKQYLIAKGEL